MCVRNGSEEKNMSGSELEIASLTADIVAAYVANNVISGDKLPEFIGSVHAALKSASVQGVEPPKVDLTPAVPVKKSVTQDYIICLEDGKKFKSLKRHLNTHYGLTPEQYREKWGLPRDYPMVAPAYAAARSDLAKNMGLGRRGDTDKPAAKEKAAKSVSKRARKAA
jgi:predicted transcriptional regulator